MGLQCLWGTKKMSKIIWQTGELEYINLPEKYKASATTWKNINPKWEYRYVSSKERGSQVKEFDNELYKIYESLDPIGQSDIWRIIIIYQEGGAYADLDSVCIQQLDKMLLKDLSNKDMVTNKNGFQQTNKYITNMSNFYSIKHSDILYDTISLLTKFSDVINMQLLFAIVAQKYQDRISQTFSDYALHSSTFKKGFDPNFFVNFGELSVKYSELVKKNGWQIITN